METKDDVIMQAYNLIKGEEPNGVLLREIDSQLYEVLEKVYEAGVCDKTPFVTPDGDKIRMTIRIEGAYPKELYLCKEMMRDTVMRMPISFGGVLAHWTEENCHEVVKALNCIDEYGFKYFEEHWMEL